MEEGRSAFKMLTNKPKGKITAGKPRHRWEDNPRMDLKEIGNSTRNWVDSVQDSDYCGIEPTGSTSHGIS